MSLPNPADFDDLVHAKVRLGVLTLLATTDWMDHTALRDALGVTDGNLSTHLRKLLEAGLVEQHKRFVQDRPNTRYRISEAGAGALRRHLQHLEQLVRGLQR